MGGFCVPRIQRGLAWFALAVVSCALGTLGCTRVTESGGDAGANARKPGSGGVAVQPGGADQGTSPLGGAPGPRPREVVIYFPDRKGLHLKAVLRAVPAGGFAIDTAVRSLLKGPQAGEELLPVVPEGTRLLGLVVTGGQAYLNLSQEFGSGTEGDGLEPLFAIVNSLTEFPEVGRVFVMVEGRPLQTYRGLEIAGGVARRQDLIESEKRVP